MLREALLAACSVQVRDRDTGRGWINGLGAPANWLRELREEILGLIDPRVRP